MRRSLDLGPQARYHPIRVSVRQYPSGVRVRISLHGVLLGLGLGVSVSVRTSGRVMVLLQGWR